MSDLATESVKAKRPASVVWRVTFTLAQLTFYSIVVLSIVATWGEPDLIDALVSNISGAPLECVTGADD